MARRERAVPTKGEKVDKLPIISGRTKTKKRRREHASKGKGVADIIGTREQGNGVGKVESPGL